MAGAFGAGVTILGAWRTCGTIFRGAGGAAAGAATVTAGLAATGAAGLAAAVGAGRAGA